MDNQKQSGSFPPLVGLLRCFVPRCCIALCCWLRSTQRRSCFLDTVGPRGGVEILTTRIAEPQDGDEMPNRQSRCCNLLLLLGWVCLATVGSAQDADKDARPPAAKGDRLLGLGISEGSIGFEKAVFRRTRCRLAVCGTAKPVGRH